MISIYTNPLFYRHETGPDHPESPDRLDFATNGVRRAGQGTALEEHVNVHHDTDRIIAKVHSEDYSRELDMACRAGHRLFHSLDNPLSPATHMAARAAVGISLTAAAEIWRDGIVERGFIIARPPGHHAEQELAMGFCFFNTIACVAEWLLEQQKIDRIFILDWDVHHGNGTQHLFETRDDVFYASLHRYPFFPGTGAADEIGVGRGRGYTKNLPLDEGAGDAEYLEAIEEEVLPLIDAYRPHAILLSAGFDAHRLDEMGGMRVTEQAFGEMSKRIVEAAANHCEGRVLSLLEGGYDPEGIASSVAEHVHVLAS